MAVRDWRISTSTRGIVYLHNIPKNVGYNTEIRGNKISIINPKRAGLPKFPKFIYEIVLQETIKTLGDNDYYIENDKNNSKKDDEK